MRDIAPDVLYRHVSFVLQDPQLLDISVRDNIALGVPGASEEAVWAAAGAARIDDYLRSLPRGLDSIIGEDAHPSGGQAQRIAIARALLVDAPSSSSTKPPPSPTRKPRPIFSRPLPASCRERQSW